MPFIFSGLRRQSSRVIAETIPDSAISSIIGSDVKVDGSIVSRGDVIVLGKITGGIRCRKLYISQNAEISGGISADAIQYEAAI